MVTDKIALSILAAGVVIAIYPFRSLILKDLSYLRMRVFTIIKAFPPSI